MSEPNSRPRGAMLPRPPLAMIFALQLAMLLGGVVILRALLGWQESAALAWNTLVGGLISWIANAWFARMVFRHSGARQMALVARSFYLGETGKFVLAASLFVTAFVLIKPLHPLALFGGYVVMTAVNSVLALRLVRALS